MNIRIAFSQEHLFKEVKGFKMVKIGFEYANVGAKHVEVQKCFLKFTLSPKECYFGNYVITFKGPIYLDGNMNDFFEELLVFVHDPKVEFMASVLVIEFQFFMIVQSWPCIQEIECLQLFRRPESLEYRVQLLKAIDYLPVLGYTNFNRFIGYLKLGNLSCSDNGFAGIDWCKVSKINIGNG
jgi:hypothetical protein